MTEVRGVTDWPIAWNCPHCGAALRAKQEAEGSKARCPKCNNELRVPGAPETPGSQGDSGQGGKNQ